MAGPGIWSFGLWLYVLSIHIALLPDKLGFKATGAQGLSLSRSIDTLLLWGRKIKFFNFNRKQMNFQYLELGFIKKKLSIRYPPEVILKPTHRRESEHPFRFLDLIFPLREIAQ